jgi:hypothetical protein
MSRRAFIREYLREATPESKLEEKIRTQTTTTFEISRDIIRELETICTTHKGTLTTTTPISPIILRPERPPRRIKPEVKAQIASIVGLAVPPPDTIESLEDFLRLGREERLRICGLTFADKTIIEDMKITDPEVKFIYDNYLETAKSDIASLRGKSILDLTLSELEEAQRIALEKTFLHVCGLKLRKYFEYLSRPDIIATYIEPEPEKKPIEKIICSQINPKWEDMILAMTKTCETARKLILEKKEPFHFTVEAEYRKPPEPFVQVTDEAYANIQNPQKLPSHKVTIRMILDAKIKIPKEKIKEAVNYLIENRFVTLQSIKTDKDLEREILLTMFKRLEHRIEELIRHICAPDIQEERISLHPHQITLFSNLAKLITSKEAMLPPGMKEEEKRRKAVEEALRDLTSMTEKAITSREEELRRMLAEQLAYKAIQVAGRTLFEVLPTEPVCPPRITVDITKRKERTVTSPVLLRAGWRIVEEMKALDVEIEIDQIEIRIEFCTPWCQAIACVLRTITPELIIEELTREARRLKFVEVKM